MDTKVTMVLLDTDGRWYIEAKRENGKVIALHLSVESHQKVPEIGDHLEIPELIEYDTGKCIVCGKTGTVMMTDVQADRLSQPHRRPINRILPNHSAEEREQVISGTHPECWSKL